MPDVIIDAKVNKRIYKLSIPLEAIVHRKGNRLVIVNAVIESGETLMAAFLGVMDI